MAPNAAGILPGERLERAIYWFGAMIDYRVPHSYLDWKSAISLQFGSKSLVIYETSGRSVALPVVVELHRPAVILCRSCLA
jgi:hypothetical protein